MNKLIFLLFVFAFQCFTICKDDSTITEKCDGKTITVPLSGDFHIALHANPSTGFDWEILEIDTTKIVFREKRFIGNNKIPGSSGLEHLVFKPVEKGTSFIKLGYLRSWEGRGSMEDSFSVFIKVR